MSTPSGLLGRPAGMYASGLGPPPAGSTAAADRRGPAGGAAGGWAGGVGGSNTAAHSPAVASVAPASAQHRHRAQEPAVTPPAQQQAPRQRDVEHAALAAQGRPGGRTAQAPVAGAQPDTAQPSATAAGAQQ